MILELSNGRAVHGLDQSKLWWAVHGLDQITNGPIGRKTVFTRGQFGPVRMGSGRPKPLKKLGFFNLGKNNFRDSRDSGDFRGSGDSPLLLHKRSVFVARSMLVGSSIITSTCNFLRFSSSLSCLGPSSLFLSTLVSALSSLSFSSSH